MALFPFFLLFSYTSYFSVWVIKYYDQKQLKQLILVSSNRRLDVLDGGGGVVTGAASRDHTPNPDKKQRVS